MRTLSVLIVFLISSSSNADSSRIGAICGSFLQKAGVLTDPWTDGLERRAGGLLVQRKPEENPSLWRRATGPIGHVAHPISYVSGKVTQRSGKPFDVSLRGAVNHSVIKPITEKVTSRVFGRPMAFTRRVTLVAGMISYSAMALGMYEGADILYMRALQNRIAESVEGFAAGYDALIQHDFRFRDIKRAQLTFLPVEKAHMAAFSLRYAQQSFIEYLQGQYEKDYKHDPATTNQYLLVNPKFKQLFADINTLVDKGVPAGQSGYVYTPEFRGTVDPRTLDELIKARIELEMNSEVIPFLIDQDRELEAMFEKSPMKAAIERYRAGRITRNQLISALQEDAFWQSRLRQWKALGIQRLKMVDGHWTNQPVTLADYQAEILASLPH